MINMYLKYTLTEDQLMESFDTLIEGMGIEDERVKKKFKAKIKSSFEKNIDIEFTDGVFYNKNTESKIFIDELIKVVELENILILKFSAKGNIIIPLSYIRETENYKNLESELKKIARENKKKIDSKDYSKEKVLICEGVNAKKQYVAHEIFNLKQSNRYMYMIFLVFTVGIITLATLSAFSNIYNFVNPNMGENPYETATWVVILCLLAFSVGIKFVLNKFFEFKISDDKSKAIFEFCQEKIKVIYGNIEKSFSNNDICGYQIKSGYLIIYIRQKKGFELIEIVLNKMDKNLKKEICRRIEELNQGKSVTAEVEEYAKRQKKKRKILFIILIVITMISFLISINILELIYKLDKTYFERLIILKGLGVLSNVKVF